MPKNILCGFNFSTYSNSSDTRVKKIKDIKIGTVYQITIENPHWSEDIFEIPIIRVPEGASDIYSIPPMAVLDYLGGLAFGYKGKNFEFRYAITGEAKDIFEGNLVHEYLKERNKDVVDKGTEIIARAE